MEKITNMVMQERAKEENIVQIIALKLDTEKTTTKSVVEELRIGEKRH